MENTGLGIPCAQINWSAAGEPEDAKTGDVYFSADDGLAETRTVFLGGCDLPARWQNQPSPVVAELGFGTGLNFLAVLALWKQAARPGQCLHYIAVEGAPMSEGELARAHALFPELAEEARALQQVWPAPVKGFHRRRLDDGVTLTLLFGPVLEMLEQLRASVDSWFLDGFAPAKNPQMWSEEVFGQLARLSAPAARLATYSVAGFVRRGLAQAGFAVDRKPGHGRKRQRLEAIFDGDLPAISIPVQKKIMIIGAGIAGACLAHGFARSGHEIVWIDGKGMASGASGNPQGLLSPRLDMDDTPLARFYRTAFVHAGQFYGQNCPEQFRQTGIHRLADTGDKQQKFKLLADHEALPPALMQLSDEGKQLHFLTAGTLNPVQAIKQLAGQNRLLQANVRRLVQDGNSWVAEGADGLSIARADVVILATGAEPMAGLSLPRLRVLRGQVSVADQIRNIPAVPVIAKSYLLALGADRLLFGATHDRVDAITDYEVTASDQLRNLAGLREIAPELAAQIDHHTLTGRTSYRAASPDLQPIAGPVADTALCVDWSKNYWGKLDDYTKAPLVPGLYMLNGLGSRGLTLAPILAELLISQIIGEPSPLEHEATTCLHPARFVARAARKS